MSEAEPMKETPMKCVTCGTPLVAPKRAVVAFCPNPLCPEEEFIIRDFLALG